MASIRESSRRGDGGQADRPASGRDREDERTHSYCDWDGVAGVRWVEVCERRPAPGADAPAERTERELGTMSEPMS